jgi:hypothetical protein
MQALKAAADVRIQACLPIERNVFFFFAGMNR